MFEVQVFILAALVVACGALLLDDWTGHRWG